jgi:hypothetical protein
VLTACIVCSCHRCRCPSAFPAAAAAQLQARQLYARDRHHHKEKHGSQDGNARLLASTCPWDKVSFDLNSPWISGNVGDTLIVRRTLTGVCSGEKRRPVHFTAVAEAGPGSDFSIVVSPPSVWLAEGESESVIITVKARSTTPLNTHQIGQVGQDLRPWHGCQQSACCGAWHAHLTKLEYSGCLAP